MNEKELKEINKSLQLIYKELKRLNDREELILKIDPEYQINLHHFKEEETYGKS